MQDVLVGELPVKARSLVKLAVQHGWTTRCTYVQYPDGKDSIAVRLRRDPSPRMFAIWIDGRFSCAASSALEPLNLGELRTRVAA